MNRRDYRTIVKIAHELSYPVLEKAAAFAVENEEVEKVASGIAEDLTESERLQVRDAQMIGIGIARGALMKEAQEVDPMDYRVDTLMKVATLFEWTEDDFYKVAEALDQMEEEQGGEEAELEDAVREGVIEAVEENLDEETLAEIEQSEELSAQIAEEVEAIKDEIMPQVVQAIQEGGEMQE